MARKRAGLITTLLRAGQRQQRAAVRLLGAALAPPKPAKKVSAPRRGTATPLAGSWRSHIFTGRGAPMSYWLYLPASAALGEPLPLVVMLHGCQQTAPDFAAGTRMNALAQKAGYAVLYPQQSLTHHRQRCWRWYDRATQQGGGEAAVIAALTEAVAVQYRIDRRRIYIGGISAGAAMAHIVALNFPGLFAALGMHSGPVFGAGHGSVGALGVMQLGAAARAGEAIAEVLLRRPDSLHIELPTIVIHGEDDGVVRPVNQVQLAEQTLHVNGLGIDGVEKVTEKPATRRTLGYRMRDVYRGRKLLLRVVRIAGLQHAWSGGDEQFTFNAAAGPDASRMLIEFFSRHVR